MDRNAVPVAAVPNKPLECCWYCTAGQCLAGFCQPHAPPARLRCLECCTVGLFWHAGMYHSPGKEVVLRRGRFDQFVKLVKVGPHVSAKWQTRSVDLFVPSTKEQGLEIPIRVYEPLNHAGSLACMVYFHGGGFCIQDKDDYGVDMLCQKLCSKRGVKLVSVSYRLAPENPFPAAVHDSLDVLKWIATKPQVLSGLDLSGGIVVAGDSAGGNLACVMSSLCRDGLDSDLTPLAEGTAPKIAAQLLFYPWLLMRVDQSHLENQPRNFLPEPVLNWFGLSYYPQFKPNEDCQERRLAPVAAGFQGLPKTIMITAGRDILKFDNAAAVTKMKEQGVDVTHLACEDMMHGFATFGFRKECDLAVQTACDALGDAGGGNALPLTQS
ncbi:hypothetical protein BASA81_000582 [Batrachochytrium salamandrivorans]|nr:hypothetical protein BASA81_000582 [Batrachochytrium salamandrivorans]